MSFPLAFCSLKQVTEPCLSQRRPGNRNLQCTTEEWRLRYIGGYTNTDTMSTNLDKDRHIFSGTHGILEKLEHILGIKGVSTNAKVLVSCRLYIINIIRIHPQKIS